jgi:hypothetical protein
MLCVDVSVSHPIARDGFFLSDDVPRTSNTMGSHNVRVNVFVIA